MSRRSDHVSQLLGGRRKVENTGAVCSLIATHGAAVSSVSARPPIQAPNMPEGSSNPVAGIEMLDGSSTDMRFNKWKIYWVTSTLMLSFLLLGIICAGAHHLYYMKLDQLPVDEFNQYWAVRIGTALAFLTRAFLMSSAAMGLQQYSWWILRRTPLSVTAIDDLTDVLGGLIPFANSELWQSAFGGCLCGTHYMVSR